MSFTSNRHSPCNCLHGQVYLHSPVIRESTQKLSLRVNSRAILNSSSIMNSMPWTFSAGLYLKSVQTCDKNLWIHGHQFMLSPDLPKSLQYGGERGQNSQASWKTSHLNAILFTCLSFFSHLNLPANFHSQPLQVGVFYSQPLKIVGISN